MSETKIFCSVIVFILGVYTIILLHYELFKLNRISTASINHGGGSSVVARKNITCTNTSFPKSKFNLNRLNCGSAGDLLGLSIQNCTELPCEIIPDVSYTAELNFSPSRNISLLEIETFVREKRDLKYYHKQRLHVLAREDVSTTVKFSFTFPAHHLQPSWKKTRCPYKSLYMVGVEIWDIESDIGEICIALPTLVAFPSTSF